ncbi:HET-domain-containing protein [Hypoxylon sp. FL1857]|nr:HET-domain-containing protein [Hypoxylon sp. FL1857]
MRLLNAKAVIECQGNDLLPRCLVEFVEEPPLYAILSHRKGYAKVRSCCLQAAQDGYEWVWIDTCCIDKSSSTELSEAINSMYRWYAGSDVCYAYLSDTTSSAYFERSFSNSKWFSRGWTLQELIAPRRVEFYNANWIELGTKSSLRERISKITNIAESILLGYTPLSQLTVALKMSWAVRRSTTREEDMAYCLMGLFDINMPLLYGEGRKAFQRLQEEIIRQYEDYSILIFESSGFLARSPADFESSIMQPSFA